MIFRCQKLGIQIRKANPLQKKLKRAGVKSDNYQKETKLVAHCAPVLLFDPPSCSLKNMAPDLAFLTQRKQSTRAPFSILLILQHKIYNVTWKKTNTDFMFLLTVCFVCVFLVCYSVLQTKEKNCCNLYPSSHLDAFDYTKSKHCSCIFKDYTKAL